MHNTSSSLTDQAIEILTYNWIDKETFLFGLTHIFMC